MARQDPGNSEDHVPAARQGVFCTTVVRLTGFTSPPSSIHPAGPIGAGRLAQCCRHCSSRPLIFYGGWASLGLPPPRPGFQWVRYGPDLLLTNVPTGQIVDAAYGAFY